MKLGGIDDPQQGGFLIRDVSQAYGYASRIEKDMRVVSKIT